MGINEGLKSGDAEELSVLSKLDSQLCAHFQVLAMILTLVIQLSDNDQMY